MSEGAGTSPTEADRLAEWQTAARPFMTRIMVALAAFFFAASLAQLGYLTWTIAHPPTLAAGTLLDAGICAPAADRPGLDAPSCFALQRERAFLMLEANVMERRYHQSNALVMFSVWSRYLGFVTGMILAFVGAAFILGKLAEPESRLEGAAGNWKASISSTSPGLILCTLGVGLIVASITTLHALNTRDAPTYVQRAPGAAAETTVKDDGAPIGAQYQEPVPEKSKPDT